MDVASGAGGAYSGRQEGAKSMQTTTETANQGLLCEVSLTGRAWRLRQADERLVMGLVHQHQLPECVARVLAARGIASEAVPDFLNPSLKASLPDPSELLDMDVAAERIASAIVGGETLAVFGDYDVDGATSSALLLRYFQAVGAKGLVHIPDRQKEGYGPNAPALLALKEKGAALVITVDCGTLSFEPLEAAHEAGLDVIVADHHQGEARRPKAHAIVNPNRLDESSPHGYLAACGVVFLLLVAVNRRLRQSGFFAQRKEPDLRAWLDIVALGTVCDVVPLVGLNRALVAQGLKIMAGRGNLGLKTLMDVAGLSEAPGVYAAGFVVGPRINAGGRVGRSDLGVRLLTTQDETEALQLARELDRLNGERKQIEMKVLEEAQMMASAQDEKTPLLLVSGEGWHPGVIGIVAGRLKEQFHKPVAVVAMEQGVGKASARSVPGYDFGAAVIAAKEAGLLVAGGGHAMAAGFTVEADKLEALHAFLAARIADPEALKASAQRLSVDAVISLGGATTGLVSQLEQIGPFGQGNPNIRVVIQGARVVKMDVVGEQHVKLLLADTMGAGRLTAMAFRAVGTKLGEALLEGRGQLLDVAGQMRINRWNGNESVNFTLDDVALHRR